MFPAGVPLAELLVFPFFLIVARVGAAVLVFPAISDSSINVRVRLLVVLGISAVLFPLLQPTLPSLPPRTGDALLLVFGELIVGLLLGLGARLMLAAMSLAGELLSFMAGFQAATLFDPQSATNTAAPTIFLTLCAGMVVLALGLHHALISAIVESYGTFPPGIMPEVGDATQAMIDTLAIVTRLGLQLAAPIVVTGLLANALFGILNRLIPQLQIFFVSVPVSITLSVLVLAASLSMMLELWGTTVAAKLTLFNVEATP